MDTSSLEHIQQYLSKASIGGTLSINDLREIDYANVDLSEDQRKALSTFDTYRIVELNSQETDEAFHKRYRELQVLANLVPFEEFLKDDYKV